MKISLPDIDFANMLAGKKALIFGEKNNIMSETEKLFGSHGALTICAGFNDDSFSGDADIFVFIPPMFEYKFFTEHTWESLNKPAFDTINSFICRMRYLLPSMKKNLYGRIIPIIYDYVDGSVPFVSAFSLYSGAISALTKNIAMEYSKYNIRANCIMMGLNFCGQKDFWNKEFDGSCSLSDCQPIKRCGNAEDIANAVLFLASEMSSFISAENLPLNGGANVIGHNQVWTDWLKKI